VQNQRQEMPDTGLFIHDIADGGTVRGERWRLDGRCVAGCGRRFGRWLGHAVRARSNRGKLNQSPNVYSCAKPVNYAFSIGDCVPKWCNSKSFRPNVFLFRKIGIIDVKSASCMVLLHCDTRPVLLTFCTVSMSPETSRCYVNCSVSTGAPITGGPKVCLGGTR
jgi:hypothetical protein